MSKAMAASPKKPARPRAKTAAERQKAYRERRAQEAGEQRINTWVAAAAVKHLNALALRHGLTQKVMLERLILSVGSMESVGLAEPAMAVEEPAASYQAKASTAGTKPRKPGATQKKSSAKNTAGKANKAGKLNKARAASKPKPEPKPKTAPKARKLKKKSVAVPPPAPVQASLWDDLL